jgi:hypothetical protein
MIGSVAIDWGKLAEAALVSAAFGIGVIVVATVAVVASLRAQDRRSAHQGGAVAFDIVTVTCVVGIAAAIVLGIYIMTQK